jgi:2,4-dienoyl-CoA reductase-like NADH-dependent reductase (Old Yellow Enzyme family)
MSKLFDKTVINGMELTNRFVRSATYEGMATSDGEATPKLIKNVTNLAKGGVGMIITGQAYVRPEGQAAPWQLGIYKDELIARLREMTDAVHENGSKILIQLNHAGKSVFSHTPLVVSKSAVPDLPTAKEIGPDDISDLVLAFADAAQRAKYAGFDGIQVHCAHGYLLSQFLTPALNQRQDQYGGNIENRTRIQVEIIQAIRKAVGKDYPVLIKLNNQDYIENGLSLEDSLKAAQILTAAGIDAIEFSGGVPEGTTTPSRTKIKKEEDEAYFKNEARKLKALTDIPIILVGGIRSFHIADSLVEDGTTDYISLCRPLIREPGLINRWKSGDLRQSLCLSDNLCYKTSVSGNGVSCDIISNEDMA